MAFLCSSAESGVYDLKAGHDLDKVSDEVYVEVRDWILKNLK